MKGKEQEMHRLARSKRFAGLIAIFMLAGIAAVSVAGASQAGNSPRSGALHVTKQCSDPPYDGTVGSFCTITSSNIAAIEPGMKVVYLAAVANGGLDSDLALGSGQGTALGHVVLDLNTVSGRVTFSVGTGRFSGFRAYADVSFDKRTGLTHWDGRYSFGGSNDDGNDD